ncbi:MAG: hypothetical protein IKW52_05085 [Alistipes sp.]|nr:hypothetical protein [Alistipes sp.]
MKNLFKNLMLVAVAAMAFTACENDNNVSAPKAEGTTYTIEVSMDDTRSMFAEMNGDAYSSQWEGSETLNVFLSNDDERYYNGATATIKVNESNPKAATITFTLPQGYDYENYDYCPAPNEGSFCAASPAESVELNSQGAIVKWDVLKEQTPRENNVDAKAHIVVAEYDGYIYSGMNLAFEHAVAYAKMSFKALPEGVSAIDSVIVKLDNNTYTLNTSYTENIWFAVQPTTPEAASITIVSGDKSYKKELAVNDKFAFETGAITGFTVDMSTAEEISADDAEAELSVDVLATDLVWNDSGYFVLTGEVVSGTAWGHSSDYIRIYLNEANRAGNNSIVPGVYTGCGGTTPNASQFGARFSLYWGTVTYPSAIGASSTLEVTYANNEYTLVLTHNGKTYGYKGMPDGWTEPSEGSQGGGDDVQEEVIDLTGFMKCNLNSLTAGAADFVAQITLSDVQYGDTYTFSLADVSGVSAASKTLKPGVYTFVQDFGSCELEASGFMYCGMPYNPTGTVTVYNQDGVYTIKCVADLGGYIFRVYYQGTL